jgi:hypothetical protein
MSVLAERGRSNDSMRASANTVFAKRAIRICRLTKIDTRRCRIQIVAALALCPAVHVAARLSQVAAGNGRQRVLQPAIPLDLSDLSRGRSWSTSRVASARFATRGNRARRNNRNISRNLGETSCRYSSRPRRGVRSAPDALSKAERNDGRHRQPRNSGSISIPQSPTRTEARRLVAARGDIFRRGRRLAGALAHPPPVEDPRRPHARGYRIHAIGRLARGEQAILGALMLMLMSLETGRLSGAATPRKLTHGE